MRIELENGLTVLLEESRTAHVAAMQLWVDVGGADETAQQAGLAHLHEHMLFKGTAKRGPGEIARSIEACGGEINAWTSHDQTVYHCVVASPFVDEALDVLSDAVTRSAFDPAELAREIEVVCEEIRRSDDSPVRRNSRALFGLAFGTHPYGRPVIGSEQSVRSFTRERILDFYRTHYVASNMTFVAVGDFDATDMLAKVKAAFAHVPPGLPSRKPRATEPAHDGPRAVVQRAPVKETYLHVGWPVPGARDEHVAALDLLASLVGQGDASLLHVEVKRERGLVNDIGSSAWTPLDQGLFLVSAALPAEKVEDAFRELLRQTYRARCEAFDGDELNRHQRVLESEAIFQKETVQGVARRLGFFETACGRADEAERYLDRAAKVTPDDVRDAAARWLHSNQLSVSVLLPQEAPELDAESLIRIAREVEAESRPRIDTTPKQYARLGRGSTSGTTAGSPAHVERLANGVTLVVKPDPTVPLVTLRAAWKGGLRAETPETNGLHALVSRTALRGTETRSARDIAHEIDALAAGLGAVSGRNSFGVRGEFLSADLDRAFDLFADVLLRPAFPEAEVDRERKLLLEDVRTRDDSPGRAAFLLFQQALWDTHPYRLDPIGREETLNAFTPASLHGLLGDLYGLDRMVLAVVGDVSIDRARTLAIRHLHGRSVTQRPFADPALDPPLTAPKEVSRKLDRRQAHLVIGFRGLSMSHPRRWALDVLSAVLSGQGGRLFLELRDKRSLAYTVSSQVSEGLDPGSFGVYIGTSPEKLDEARTGIRRELERIRDEDVSPAELDRARRYLIGAHEIGQQRLSARAGTLALDEAYGFGATHHLGTADRIAAVTAADIRAIAGELIDFDRSVTALVSP